MYSRCACGYSEPEGADVAPDTETGAAQAGPHWTGPDVFPANGARGGNRTPDLDVRTVLLYPLSYAGSEE